MTLTMGDIAQASDFGAYGQSNFENNWAASLGYCWTQVVKFESRMDDYANSAWGNVARDLHGAKYFFEGGCDQCSPGGLDSVDIVYFGGHTGTNSTVVAWTMWDGEIVGGEGVGDMAYNTRMTLGNEGDRLRLFMSYSCKGLHNDDNNIHWRWDNIVKGGLQVTTGSTQLMYFGENYKYKGKNVADRLINRETIGYAWGNGTWGAATINRVQCIPERVNRIVTIDDPV